MTPETVLAFDGTEQAITEWALDYGLTPEIIIGRLTRGASIKAAITTPMRTAGAGQKLPIYHKHQKSISRPKKRVPGVLTNLCSLKNTAAPSTAQETTKIYFSEGTRND